MLERAIRCGSFLLLSGAPEGRLDPLAVGVALALLAALGLRDKVPFLAARAEIYGNLMIIFLFPLGNLVVAVNEVLVRPTEQVR